LGIIMSRTYRNIEHIEPYSKTVAFSQIKKLYKSTQEIKELFGVSYLFTKNITKHRQVSDLYKHRSIAAQKECKSMAFYIKQQFEYHLENMYMFIPSNIAIEFNPRKNRLELRKKKFYKTSTSLSKVIYVPFYTEFKKQRYPVVLHPHNW
jgi:hypothetical protein